MIYSGVASCPSTWKSRPCLPCRRTYSHISPSALGPVWSALPRSRHSLPPAHDFQLYSLAFVALCLSSATCLYNSARPSVALPGRVGRCHLPPADHFTPLTFLVCLSLRGTHLPVRGRAERPTARANTSPHLCHALLDSLDSLRLSFPPVPNCQYAMPLYGLKPMLTTLLHPCHA